MSRYKYTKIKIGNNGKRVFRPTMIPTIPLRDSDIFIYPVFGERLDTLAHKYYGDVSLWWIIAKANGINGKLGLDPSIEIRIPQNVTDILDKFTQLNKY